MSAPSVTHAQRWSEGRASYRPAREVIDPSRYDLCALSNDRDPKAFIERHHYSASYPAARRRFALYDGLRIVGVAVYSQPMADIFGNYFSAPADECLELGRLVLLDEVPANAETWFIARTFAALRREGFAGVLAFSDPTPRATASGEVIFRGHVGTIYQASNAHYLGRATARTLRLLPDGAVFSDRTAQKIRAQERGHAYAEAQLVAAGAPPRALHEDPRAWLKVALALVARTLRHPGNHRYGWALNRKAWPNGAQSGAYPKQLEVRS